MNEHEWLARQFEENRGHLRAIAYRMLGSQHEADDAVQECWLRLSRSPRPGSIENLGGWLTTVVARICLDMLRSRTSRHEQSLEIPEAVPSIASGEKQTSPEYEMLMADSLGVALLMVLETLTPAERVAFVLHDMFDMPFDEIAPIVGRSPAAARQLASRARRRVQDAAIPDFHVSRQRKVVDAFLEASRNGDFNALLAVLDPDVVLHADRAAVDLSAAREAYGAPKLAPEIRGAAAVAETFKGRAGAALPALVNGSVGLAWAPGGKPRAVFALTITSGKIAAIDLIADPERIRQVAIAVLSNG